MAVVSDITVVELTAEIRDQSVADWWDNAPALPQNVTFIELMGKTHQAAYIAQQKKNAAGNPSAGEALNGYSQPTTTNVTTDVATGIQTFTATHSYQVVYSVDQNLAVPSYI